MILLIIGLSLLLVGFIVIAIGNINDHDWMVPIGTAIMFVATFIMLIAGSMLSEKNAYKEALEGRNPYEKVYQYEKTDKGYIVVDSTYIKKE